MAAGTASFGQSNYNCNSLKLSPLFFKDFPEEPKLSWTEEKAYFIIPGSRPEYKLNIIDKLLAYQNDLMSECSKARPPQVDHLFTNPRVENSTILKMTIAIGYNDIPLNDYVSDQYYYTILVAKFSAACEEPSQKNCGFKIDQFNANEAILTKKIWNEKTLEIKIFKASISYSDKFNRSSQKQTEMSDLTQKKFYDSFTNSHFVFYLGHSRNGGGPDFSPAKLLANQHPDYAWYNENKVNILKMSTELGKLSVDQKPLVIGLLSCSSRLHFQNRLRKVLPDSTLMVTKQATYNIELFQGVLVFINGIQQKKSIEEMNIDFQAVNLAHRQNGKETMSLLMLTNPVKQKRN
jgi:hypothetical protein